MKYLLLGIIAISSSIAIAQENQLKTFQIVNKTYPDEKIVFSCLDNECSLINITGIETSVHLDQIDLNKLQEDSAKAVGKIKVDCSEFVGPGAPCFGITGGFISMAKRNYKEGRVLNGILSTLGTAPALVLDLFSTSTIILPLSNYVDAKYETEAEISREDRRQARIKIKKFNYVQSKLKKSNESGILEVNDRMFDKITRKLNYMDNPYYNRY